MSDQSLDLANRISVSVLGGAAGLGPVNINTIALFSRATPNGSFGSGAYKVYTRVSDVTTDWGSGSSEENAAVAIFSQQPNILSTGGYLVIIPRTSFGSETIAAAIARTTSLIDYHGILIDQQLHDDPTTFASLTAYIQTLDKIFFHGSNTAADYAATTGMYDVLRLASKTHTRCLFHSTTPLEFAAAYAGRFMSTDFSGSNTCQSADMKPLATINPDTAIDQTALTACAAAGVDVYANLSGLPSVLESGNNAYFDQIYNRLALKFDLQVAAANFLRQTSTKVPQTTRGIMAFLNANQNVLKQYVRNAMLAPGTWTSPDTFGDSEALIRGIKDYGYYLYATPLELQSKADREARKCPTIQIAVKEAGAVKSANIIVDVNI